MMVGYVKRATLAVMISMALKVSGNNLMVKNVTLLGQDVEAEELSVVFDLQWDNSWCNITNNDAAWIFIKFRAPKSNDWQHAYLSLNANAHWAENGVIATGLSSNDNREVGVGIFVSDASAHSGSVAFNRMRLRWHYGASGYSWPLGAEVEVAVHAIEMVYVAEGTFYLGSGGSESGSFTDGAWTAGTSFPFRVTSETELTR